MRILIFSTAYLPFVGGAEVAVKEITDRLSTDFEFDLITARLDARLSLTEKIGAVTVYRIGIGWPFFDKLMLPFLGAIKAWQLNQEKGYSAFWGIMASFSTGAAYIVNMIRGAIGRKRMPMVLTLQEGDSEEYLQTKWLGLIDLSWRMAFRRTDMLTAISTYLLDRARRLGFKGRSFLVPNGVDLKRFENASPRALGETVALITTSRLNVKNGVGDVIAALPLLPPNVIFRVAGTGELEKKLRRQARELNLEDRVEFLGLVPPAEIPQQLHKADIFIRPSLSEGMGNSFIEAMAAGLPVIATPVGGIPDFLTDGETGVFCQPGDTESIARAVKRLTNDNDFNEKIRERALRMVRERYGWDMVAEEMKTAVFAKV
jgi:glycosyltransferase involved in cell wall biosynthesis